MTDGVIHVPQVDLLNSGRLLSIATTGAFASSSRFLKRQFGRVRRSQKMFLQQILPLR
jgi:hypothetical protein